MTIHDLLPEDLNHQPLHLTGEWLDQVRQSGCVLYIRATTPKQRRGGQLANDVEAAESWLGDHGVPVHKTIAEVESNCIHADRQHLERAIRKARKLHVPVVTSTRDRFIRHSGYDGRKRTESPTEDEYRLLRTKFGYCGYFTIEHPDCNGRSVQIKRSGNAGRPKRKRQERRKDELLPKAIELYKAGISKKEIARRLGTGRTNVLRWLQQEGY